MPTAALLAIIANVGLLQQITAERTRLLAAKMKLYQSTFNPDPTNVVADFVAAEATFTGYAAVTIVWNAVGVDQDGGYSAIGSNCFFQATDAVTPNTIGGCWIEDSAGALKEFIPFGTPVPMSAALDALSVIPILRQPPPDQGNLTY
jgi:hypothetical protein